MFRNILGTKTEDLELNQLHELKLPPLIECCYTSCYCEENVWKLCEYVKKTQPNLLSSCYAVFISNNNQSVPLWHQKSGNDSNKLAIWDYHVIFLYKPNNGEGALIYDLDSVLPFPMQFEEYATLTFQTESCLQKIYHRHFRVVPAEAYLNTFASDRSRMKKPDGSWIKEPPPYPCISTKESSNNIDDFISMNPAVGIGEIMNLEQFLKFQ